MDRSVNLGKCLAGLDMVINRIAPHHYEEPPISGTNGSGTIFFGGCTMKCDYCQNFEISRVPVGKRYSPYQLSEQIRRLEDSGVHNINFVSPSHYAQEIIKTLDIYRPKIPTVYNCSGYEKLQTIESLKGYIDIYLPDFKYSSNELGEHFSHIKNYTTTAQTAISAMLSQVEDSYDENGIMQSGVIVRHLILPSYIENSKNVLLSLSDMKARTVSLMSQFTPMQGCKELARKIKPIEYKIVSAYAEKLDFPTIYVQELLSASEDYIPDFDTKGEDLC